MIDEIDITWTDIKILSDNKGFGLQYVTAGTDYVIWFVEDIIKYTAIIQITSPAGSDQTDFENNYKANANKPVFIGEDEVISALAIRDTADHTSTVSDSRGAIPKTVVIYNETDEDIQVQLQGDRDEDFDEAMNIGTSFTVIASTHDYATISDYMPYLRVVITAGTAPTTGTVSAYLLRVRR